MCLAALWLYKATKEQRYLREVESYFDDETTYSINYQDKLILCQVRLVIHKILLFS